MNQFIFPEDDEARRSAKTYVELGQVGLTVLRRMSMGVGTKPIGQVCGPISHGGLGSVAANLRVFSEWIERLQDKRIAIFDQVPFERDMFRIWHENGGTDGEGNSNDALLVGFYIPLFESGLIKKLYFIPGWSESYGSLWEHRQARRLGIAIDYL